MISRVFRRVVLILSIQNLHSKEETEQMALYNRKGVAYSI